MNFFPFLLILFFISSFLVMGASHDRKLRKFYYLRKLNGKSEFLLKKFTPSDHLAFLLLTISAK